MRRARNHAGPAQRTAPVGRSVLDIMQAEYRRQNAPPRPRQASSIIPQAPLARAPLARSAVSETISTHFNKNKHGFELMSKDTTYARREFRLEGDMNVSALKFLGNMPYDEMIRFHFYRYDQNGQRHDWGTKMKLPAEHVQDIMDQDDRWEIDDDVYSRGRAAGGYALASGSGGSGGEDESPWVQQLSNKAIYRIKNDDDLCGQRCLVLADMTESNRKTMHKRPDSFTKKAKILGKKRSVNGRMNHVDFDRYASMYKRQVVIFGSKRDVVYATPEELSLSKNFEGQAEPVFICWDPEQSHYH